MILNSISSNNKNTTVGCYVKFYNLDGTPYDLCNNLLDGFSATYDVAARTLTIPIKKYFTMVTSDGSATMIYNCLTGIDMTDTSASGTAERDALEIIVDNFDGDNGTYSAHLVVSRYAATTGADVEGFEFDVNMVFTLIDLDYCGDATAADVVKGKTFTSAAGLNVDGTHTSDLDLLNDIVLSLTYPVAGSGFYISGSNNGNNGNIRSCSKSSSTSQLATISSSGFSLDSDSYKTGSGNKNVAYISAPNIGTKTFSLDDFHTSNVTIHETKVYSDSLIGFCFSSLATTCALVSEETMDDGCYIVLIGQYASTIY